MTEHIFTREELYELVWDKPMRTVAASCGVSDVALAKVCRKANIPVPERGYWARKAASKPTIKVRLAPRFPGASNMVGIGRSLYQPDPNWRQTILDSPIPAPPVFEESMDALEKRVRTMVGHVTYRGNFDNPHSLASKLLANDDQRRADQKMFKSTYYAPIYDREPGRRWLLILNSILIWLGRLGCSASMKTSRYTDDKDRIVSIRIGDQSLEMQLDMCRDQAQDRQRGAAKTLLRLTVRNAGRKPSTSTSWNETEGARLEAKLTDIIVALLFLAESAYRSGALEHREWLIQRKVQVAQEIAEIAARKLVEEQERRKRVEKQNVERLLAEAADLQTSQVIRTYVEAVRHEASRSEGSFGDFDRWAEWALAQADRIDPVKSRRFILALTEPARDVLSGAMADDDELDECDDL